MSKVRTISLELPSEEEFEKLFESVSEEAFEENLAALDNVGSIEELLDLLSDMGIKVTDMDEIDNELPGPHDTIH